MKYFTYWKFDILRISNNEIKKIKRTYINKGKKERKQLISKKNQKKKYKQEIPN